MMVKICRRLHGLFDAPSKLEDPTPKRRLIDSEALGPIEKRHGFATISNWGRRTSVACLVFECGPFNVARLVSAIVVDSLNGVARRTLGAISNVGKKVGKRLAPAFAHEYSTTAVVGVIGVVFIVTTSEHGDPCAMLWSSGNASGLPFLKHGRDTFTSQATARERFSAAQGGDSYYAFAAAVASAKEPAHPMSGLVGFGDHGQAPESVTSDDTYPIHTDRLSHHGNKC